MTRTLKTRWILRMLLPAVTVGLTGCGIGAPPAEPINKIVIVVDVSGSYARRLPDAVTRATRLVEDIATTKTNRWDTSLDQLTIVALDAMPSVLWNGDLKELKTLEPGFWSERLKGRSDYSRCTDVPAAFQLAAKSLEGDPRAVSKYVFAFTDLINEPPTNDVRTCTTPRLPSGPSEEFPWESLSDASVSTFWLPPNQALAWRRAAQERGLNDTFAFYTLSESASAPIPAPPRPKMQTTVAEQEQQRRRVINGTWSVARTVGQVAVAGLALMFGGAWVAARRRRPRPAPRNGQQVTVPGRPRPLATRPRPGVNGRTN
jgi:hypothetical protein